MDFRALLQQAVDEVGELRVENAAKWMFALATNRDDTDAAMAKWPTLAPALREKYREQVRVGLGAVSMWMRDA